MPSKFDNSLGYCANDLKTLRVAGVPVSSISSVSMRLVALYEYAPRCIQIISKAISKPPSYVLDCLNGRRKWSKSDLEEITRSLNLPPDFFKGAKR